MCGQDSLPPLTQEINMFKVEITAALSLSVLCLYLYFRGHVNCTIKLLQTLSSRFGFDGKVG